MTLTPHLRSLPNTKYDILEPPYSAVFVHSFIDQSWSAVCVARITNDIYAFVFFSYTRFIHQKCIQRWSHLAMRLI